MYGIFHLVVLVALGDRHWAFSTWNTDSGVCSMGLEFELQVSFEVAAGVAGVWEAGADLIG